MLPAPTRVITTSLAAALALTACDPSTADLLGVPEVLAIQVDPPGLRAGADQTLTAFGWRLAEPFVWEACSGRWSPDDLSCGAGDALALGEGNPITVRLPDADLWWLKVQAAAEDGLDIPPAVLLMEPAEDASQANPVLSVIEAVPATESDPEADPGDLALTVVLEGTAPEDTVITWHVTGGEISPQRALASVAVTFSAGAELAAGEPITVVAVARTEAGGAGWTQAALVAP